MERSGEIVCIPPFNLHLVRESLFFLKRCDAVFLFPLLYELFSTLDGSCVCTVYISRSVYNRTMHWCDFYTGYIFIVYIQKFIYFFKKIRFCKFLFYVGG